MHGQQNIEKNTVCICRRLSFQYLDIYKWQYLWNIGRQRFCAGQNSLSAIEVNLHNNRILHKISIQIFVNRCLRYILRIRWPNVISNKDLWRVTDQEDINLEIRKRKFRWIGHTLKIEDGEVSKAALLWNPEGSRKRWRPKNSWRRSVIKEAGRSWNELRFLAADRSGRNS